MVSGHALVFQISTECPEQLLDPSVQGFLFEVERAGDLHDLEPVVVPHADDDPVLGRQGLHDLAEGFQIAVEVPVPFAVEHSGLRSGIRRGHGLQRFLALHASGGAIRQPAHQIGQLGVGHPDPMIPPHELAGLFERVAVPVHVAFQQLGFDPVAPGRSGRPPLAPLRSTPVDKLSLDGGDQVSFERRSIFAGVLAQEAVVVLHEPGLDVGREFVGVLGRQPLAPGDVIEDLVDQLGVLEVEIFGCFWLGHGGGWVFTGV